MKTDPILDELHETRRRLLAEAGDTLEGLVAGLRKRQQASGRSIVTAGRTNPLNVRGPETDAAAEGIVAAVRESRERGSDGDSG